MFDGQDENKNKNYKKKIKLPTEFYR